MKPRIFLAKVFVLKGIRVEQWICHDSPTSWGFGNTPTQAYDDWLLQALKA